VAIEKANLDEMVELLKLGAIDYFTLRFRPMDTLPRVSRLLKQTHKYEKLDHFPKNGNGVMQLIGQSPLFLAEIKKIPLVAKCDAGVLISGETGTGKEVCARAIHYHSPRASKPFIPVNCGAIPMELAENELFGHEQGAFTGATRSKAGLIHEAEGGSLFLDEIDSLPLLAQVKLLRFIQEKEYRPLGSTKVRQAAVRIITAINMDPAEAVKRGKLRRDLYYRLNVMPICLPPLRRRHEDIPVLAHHFLEKYEVEYNKRVAGFSRGAMQILMLYDWPGNVRELENVVQRAVVLTEQGVIDESNIILPNFDACMTGESFKEAKEKCIIQFEKKYIQSLLIIYQGNITKAAQAAKKNRRAFWQLIQKHQIDVPHLKASIAHGGFQQRRSQAPDRRTASESQGSVNDRTFTRGGQDKIVL